MRLKKMVVYQLLVVAVLAIGMLASTVTALAVDYNNWSEQPYRGSGAAYVNIYGKSFTTCSQSVPLIGIRCQLHSWREGRWYGIHSTYVERRDVSGHYTLDRTAIIPLDILRPYITVGQHYIKFPGSSSKTFVGQTESQVRWLY